MKNYNNDELEIELVLENVETKCKEEPITQTPLMVVDDGPDDRYSRLRLIPWWDQELLMRSRVMVVGAGAIGNELLKNLAMLGIGNVFVVDLDTVENSNLSRSVLFRAEDEGQAKAEVASKRMRDINPGINVRAFRGNVVHDVGLGAFRAMDVVLGGLDNREARLGINMACWKVNRPWIDGAIEVLHGVARVFVPPDGACYECTMNETDFKLLALRRSCALLQREEMLAGKVPTTPTTASIIAGIQVQELLKVLHKRRELPILAGKGFCYNGLTHDSYIVTYPRKADCMSHETFDFIEETELSARTTKIRELLRIVRERLGEEAVIDFRREIITQFCCVACGTAEPVFKALGRVTEQEARCPKCNQVRELDLMHTIEGTEAFLDMTLFEIGIPLFDIITGRNGMEEIFIELSGDRLEVLGPIG